VRYRWYPDVQTGTNYFHDHVNALRSWQHGLFGALISEPPGSTYHDPHTGAAIRSGLVADVHTEAKVSADVAGSFRELVMLIQDNNRITHLGDSSGGSFNLRVQPLNRGSPVTRGGFPSQADPATTMLSAYVGDPVVVRTLVAGSNDV